MGGRTYSLGNSPSANEQSNDVFPQAPVVALSNDCGGESRHRLAISDNDQLSSDLM
jgi:hypothetical protein